jgi:hypothetical protein
MFIQESTTSQLQVLGMVINKPFKVELYRLYGEWLLFENCQHQQETQDKPKQCLCSELRQHGTHFTIIHCPGDLKRAAHST